jgi:hypothetical protein
MVEFRNQPHHLPTFDRIVQVRFQRVSRVRAASGRAHRLTLRVIWSATTCSIKLSKA